jgi:glycosyltransferase involved in cell wall biosynthesis
VKKIGFLTERMILGFGVDLVIHNVAKGLAEKGYQVTVYTTVSDGTYENEIYRLKVLPTPPYNPAPLFELSALRWLRYLKKEKIDLFFIETFPFYIFPFFLSVPCVALFYGTSSTLGLPWKKKLNFWYMDRTQKYLYYRFAKRVITISHYLESNLPRNIRRKTRVIYNGADHYHQDFRPATLQNFYRSWGIGEKDILLLYVGRINPSQQPYKGTRQLAQIYKRVRAADRRIKLLLAGYGTTRDKEWLGREGILTYLNVPVENMGLVYTACDIYVTASGWEGFNLPLAEAQWLGKPTVAWRLGAHPEVVADGKSGLLCFSEDDFVNSVLTLARDKKLRLKMGRNASRHAGRFRWKATIEEYCEVVEKLLR